MSIYSKLKVRQKQRKYVSFSSNRLMINCENNQQINQ